SSHILPDVERLCNRVGIIRHGELIAVEEVEVLRRRSIRYMEVELKDGADAISASVPEVTSVERRGNRLKIGVRGNVTPLLQELARLGVEDMVYEQAHLEDIFLDYYRGTDAAGPEEDTPGA
ncbi:MAG: ABC transporter ATP-binding protein, partial [Chloroflexi bacterium]|nr:ABC transporter ATP-binding protein [Chloroflexota bacterium]